MQEACNAGLYARVSDGSCWPCRASRRQRSARGFQEDTEESHFTSDKTCFIVWEKLWQASPVYLLRWLQVLACSPVMLHDFVVRARLLGKGTSKPHVDEVRAILPLPPPLQLLDYMVAASFAEWIGSVLPVPPCCYTGGGRGTQVTDFKAGISLVLEKGVDSVGCSACAQADIKSY